MAVSSLAADDARQREDVRSFREEVLHGKLMRASEVHSWILKQLEQDGRPLISECELKVRMDRNAYTALLDNILWPHIDELGHLQIIGVSSSIPTIRYVTPKSKATDAVPVLNPDGVLARLHSVITGLVTDLEWGEVQAGIFVLTDLMPLIGISMSVKLGDETRRITMRIPPWYSAEEVAEAYRGRAKHFPSLRSGSARSLAERTSQLVQYVCATPGITWEGRLEDWNAQWSIRNWGFKSAWQMSSVFHRAARRLHKRFVARPKRYLGRRVLGPIAYIIGGPE